MEFETKINNKMVTVKLVKKRGMKHTYLRVISSSMLQINTNYYFTQKDAEVLITNKQKWLEKHFNSIKSNIDTNEFYFLGVKHKNLDERDLNKFYKDEAKKIIPLIVEKYSKIMNLYPSSIKYRKNRRTWGSCNYKNGLNFNTLLVKFPIEIIEYVVIHELAHIKEKNHSKRFWSLVEVYCPDYKCRVRTFKSLL